jgi:hypothetical protein
MESLSLASGDLPATSGILWFVEFHPDLCFDIYIKFFLFVQISLLSFLNIQSFKIKAHSNEFNLT